MSKDDNLHSRTIRFYPIDMLRRAGRDAHKVPCFGHARLSEYYDDRLAESDRSDCFTGGVPGMATKPAPAAARVFASAAVVSGVVVEQSTKSFPLRSWLNAASKVTLTATSLVKHEKMISDCETASSTESAMMQSPIRPFKLIARCAVLL